MGQRALAVITALAFAIAETHAGMAPGGSGAAAAMHHMGASHSTGDRTEASSPSGHLTHDGCDSPHHDSQQHPCQTDHQCCCISTSPLVAPPMLLTRAPRELSFRQSRIDWTIIPPQRIPHLTPFATAPPLPL
jgi:hypothetical protein